MAKLSKFGQEIFLSKYANSDETEWEQCARRVSRYIAQAENGNQSGWEDKFFETINDLDFIPGGRILKNAGQAGQSMMNCFSLEPMDNVESLGDLLKNTYKITCAGGGIGYNFSAIRPRGDSIRNMKYSAPGAVSEIRKINAIGEETKGWGSRRTALLGILNVTHPDILDFLHIKLDLNEINNFNISIGITNDFIKAVEKNKEWAFSFNNRNYYVYEIDRVYRNGKRETIQLTALDDEDVLGRAYASHKKNFTDKFENPKKVEYKARDLWNQVIENARISGDPGFFNLDLVNNFTSVSYFEKLNQCNACSELPLPGNAGSCCLGAINLDNFYDEEKHDVNWKKLAKVIRAAVRFLDNVVTLNHYPISISKQTSHKSRRIGLGVMGLHYLLIRLGYRYGSNDSLEFLERIYQTIRNEAYMTSVEIAKEKGAFPAFDAELYLREEYAKTLPPRIRRAIKKYGIRNAVMLSGQPTGTTSIVAGVSSSIEPIFSPVYKRSFRDLQNPSIWQHTIVVDKLFKEFYTKGMDTRHIVGAYDVTPEEHLNVQATVQKFLDNSTSKTINLPENIKTKELSDIIFEFISDLKGVTIYRQNSRGVEPLQPISVSNKKDLEKLMHEVEESEQPEALCKSGKCDL